MPVTVVASYDVAHVAFGCGSKRHVVEETFLRHTVARIMEVAGQAQAQQQSPAAYGSKLIQGLKARNEDALVSVPDFHSNRAGTYQFYGVFDGHGGGEVSEYCAGHLHEHLLKQLEAVVEEEAAAAEEDQQTCGCSHQVQRRALEGAFTRAFAEADARVAETIANVASCGSTACVALVHDSAIVIANCGDSRAVVFRDGLAVPLTFDHRPSRQDETERVLASGGQILWNSGSRVMGILACTRSIGDKDLHAYGVSSIPEVHYVPRTDADEFMIIATDGVWNVLENDVVCVMIRRCLKRAADRNATRSSAFRMAADVVGRMAKDKGSRDDIAVLVIDLVCSLDGQLNPLPCSCAQSTGLSASMGAVLANGRRNEDTTGDSNSSSSNGETSRSTYTACPPVAGTALAPDTSQPGSQQQPLATSAVAQPPLLTTLSVPDPAQQSLAPSSRGSVETALPQDWGLLASSSAPAISAHAPCTLSLVAPASSGSTCSAAASPRATPSASRLAIHFALQSVGDRPMVPSAAFGLGVPPSLTRTQSLAAAAVGVIDDSTGAKTPVKHGSCSAEIFAALVDLPQDLLLI